jgi:hypothetical protein
MNLKCKFRIIDELFLIKTVDKNACKLIKFFLKIYKLKIIKINKFWFLFIPNQKFLKIFPIQLI